MIQYWNYENANFLGVEDSYGARKIVRNDHEKVAII